LDSVPGWLAAHSTSLKIKRKLQQRLQGQAV
jgi:hypothetical protein